MATLTISHPMAEIAPLSADTLRKLVVWASVAVIIVVPALLSAAVLLQG
jgi:hypothetical protein